MSMGLFGKLGMYSLVDDIAGLCSVGALAGIRGYTHGDAATDR